jgi:cathepsin A (carboxypeptidase C)
MSGCDPDVKSYSGYLDIGEDKHLWFAFFESRTRKAALDKTKEPIVMWLNGGPGCSSTTGWLMEKIGPCTIDKNGTAVKYNEHSWTNHASVFFLDQPVNVGYSYSDGEDVNNTPQGAEDVYAFLQLFFAKFDEYASSPFTIAAESYGGRYSPLYASKIYTENKKIAARSASVQTAMAPKAINLESIMIGNGLTDPLIQFPSTADYLCDSKYGLFEEDSQECSNLKSKAATCSNLISNCYKYNSRLTCLPAALYCWSGLYTDAQNSGRNLYDLRKKCDRDPDADGPLCYREETYVETYLNLESSKKMFGVPDKVTFQACNMQVNQGFMFQGDSMHNSAEVLPEMIEGGVRVLVYAGEYDSMCNWFGNIGDNSWPLQMNVSVQAELNESKKDAWVVNGKKAGWVRRGGKGAGQLTLVKIANAGHMVPFDQPEAAEAMVKAWLSNKSIA